MSSKIIIVGGGISGITTALCLQLLGFETTIFADKLVEEKAERDPRFASLYPAASVIPHSVKSDKLNTLFPASQQVFSALHDLSFEPLVLHRHFELYEFPKKLPDYAHFLHNFSLIENAEVQQIPRRKYNSELHGWVFNCFVASWPDYIYKLYELYKSCGGNIKKRTIQQTDIPRFKEKIIINCTGIWSSTLFEDSAPPEIIRGHLVHVHGQESIIDSKNRVCSYNYTPDPEIYTTPQRAPSDVYCYPIGNRWVLGGSRQVGTLINETWQGSTHDETVLIDDLEIPKPIIELNKEILENTYQVNFNHDSSKMNAYAGYRFSRDHPTNGLRLEKSEEFGKTIIHNYGHGGAGVTLSWGCALKILQLISGETGDQISITPKKSGPSWLNDLQLRLQKVYLNYL